MPRSDSATRATAPGAPPGAAIGTATYSIGSPRVALRRCARPTSPRRAAMHLGPVGVVLGLRQERRRQAGVGQHPAIARHQRHARLQVAGGLVHQRVERRGRHPGRHLVLDEPRHQPRLGQAGDECLLLGVVPQPRAHHERHHQGDDGEHREGPGQPARARIE